MRIIACAMCVVVLVCVVCFFSSGRISLKTAKIYAISLFLISIIISFFISYLVNSYWPSVIVVCAAILMYVYASHLKAMPLIGNIVVASLTGFCFIFQISEYNII